MILKLVSFIDRECYWECSNTGVISQSFWGRYKILDAQIAKIRNELRWYKEGKLIESPKHLEKTYNLDELLPNPIGYSEKYRLNKIK